MGKVKVLTARQAADLIKDGDTVTLSGFVANGIAEALNAAAEERFLETGHPKDLTLFWVQATRMAVTPIIMPMKAWSRKLSADISILFLRSAKCFQRIKSKATMFHRVPLLRCSEIMQHTK